MRTRFVSNMVLMVAGAFLVVSSQAFAPYLTAWLAFGIALGIIALDGVVQLDRSRGMVQRLIDLGTGALAIATVVTSVVYSGTPITWLVLGEAIGFFALATIGLVAHELRTERVVYALESTVGERERTESYSATA